MNKKDGKKKKTYDDKEDLAIKEAAYYKSSSQVLLLFVLIILFGFTLFNSLMYIGKYYINKNKVNNGIEIIEIKNSKNSVLINNEGHLVKQITENEDNDEIILVNKSSITLETHKDEKEDGIIKFDVKYNLLKNTFLSNTTSKNDSDVRVRFAYSFDNENWTYVNNAISTYESTLSPLLGNYYDIAGLESTLKVATNYELTCKSGKSKTMYWKSETVIKNKNENIGKNIEAEFKIDYKESL